MARNRMIKHELWTADQFVGLSPLARLLFIGSWNFADDNGIFKKHPKQLKRLILPDDDVDADVLFTEIIAAELWCEFKNNEENYIFITGFPKHQVVRHHSIRYPLPLELLEDYGYIVDYSRNVNGVIQEDSGKPTGSLPEAYGNDAGTCRQKRREEKRREEKGRESPDISLELQDLAFRVLGTVPPGNLIEAIGLHGESEIRAALLKAEAAGKKRWPYVNGILKSRAADGYPDETKKEKKSDEPYYRNLDNIPMEKLARGEFE